MKVALKSDVGKKRSNNQDFSDYFLNKKGYLLAVLCDGMGGHRSGDVASSMVVSHLGKSWCETEFQTTKEIKEWLYKTINIENQRLLSKAKQSSELTGMGTTIVVAATSDDGVIIANIGDSRAYCLANKQLKQLTEDHSLVQELVKSGEITTSEAQNHPRKNVLTRSMGVNEPLLVDLFFYAYQTEELILLCSDGLTNMVSPDEIKKILLLPTPLEEKVNQLVNLANQRGGLDNITALLIDFDDREEEEDNENWKKAKWPL